MKKLIYSTLVAFIAASLFVGCGDSGNGGDGDDDVKKGPSIEFQTNTGTFGGYTFADGSVPVKTTIKIGAKISSTDVNLKSTKMTVKYNNQAEQIVGTDSIIAGSTKTCNRDYTFYIPDDKGTYVFTVYATDKNATTSTAKITIQAFGAITDRLAQQMVYSLQAVDGFSAYDLFEGEAITAAGTTNLAQRDIVDMSTNTTLSKSWKSQNGTEFVISGADGKLNGKVYSQFQSEADLIAAWNATSGKGTTVTGIDEGKLIIAKSVRGGVTYYYLIGIDAISDEGGSETDFIEFHYAN